MARYSYNIIKGGIKVIDFFSSFYLGKEKVNYFKNNKGSIIVNDKIVDINYTLNVSDKLVKANSVDAAFEKHVPQYEVKGDKLEVFVNHVMEDDHYIEWIMVDYGDKQIVKHFKPSDEPKLTVDYKDGVNLFSYCNKHGLWMNKEVYKAVKL